MSDHDGKHGGDLVAEFLAARGVRHLFTLCGGHISPILTGAKRLGIRVVDARGEATAVFAADAVSRLSGRPGVAAVTAGPGVTNSVTALKNAQMAPSSLVLLGGATATLLRGRGALQDIDQVALVRSLVKWRGRARRLADIVPLLDRAFTEASAGVPGPVFLELPVDLLYPEALVRQLYGLSSEKKPRGLAGWVERALIERHVRRLFAEERARAGIAAHRTKAPEVRADRNAVGRAAALLKRAQRPVLLVGGQATLRTEALGALAAAIGRLGIPTYLSGMARGLLGREQSLQMRHRRKEALREADFVLLAGVPCDFRLEYGRHIGREASVVAVNVRPEEVRKNRKPRVGVAGDPARFLIALAEERRGPDRGPWLETLRKRDGDRDRQIEEMAGQPAPPVHPLRLCRAIESAAAEDATFVADGGDFVATASYVVRPRRPLSWLDPGVFGTLGGGAGFAIGAKACRPDSEVWILYGDGSAGYSLQEFDTFVRHGLPVIAVVANDASWMQIARDQVAMLGDAVGTDLRRTDYHVVAEGWGGRGLLLDDERRIDAVLAEAKSIARVGSPVLINAHLGATEFRKGSISL